MRSTCFATAFFACQLVAFAAALPDGVRRVKVLNLVFAAAQIPGGRRGD